MTDLQNAPATTLGDVLPLGGTDWRIWSDYVVRSAGFAIIDHPEEEVFVCRCVEPPTGAGAAYPARPRRNGQSRNGRP